MRSLIVSGLFFVFLGSVVCAAPMVAKSTGTLLSPDHIMVTGSALQWTEGPASLPKGAQSAVLEGDPKQPGPFTIRARFPAGYVVPPHWHPADEHVTVLSGSLSMGMGETVNKAAATELTAGGFAMMAKGVRHFAFSQNGAELQIHGIGPWGITYVNLSDDPRAKK